MKGVIEKRAHEAPKSEIVERDQRLTYGEDRDPWKNIIVKNGDTLAELAISVYGHVNDNILKLIKKFNPEIKDIDLIEKNQKIVFPPLSLLEQGEIYKAGPM